MSAESAVRGRDRRRRAGGRGAGARAGAARGWRSISQEPRPAGAGRRARISIRASTPSVRETPISSSQLGAWSAIPEARRTPVHAMRVYGDDGASLIEFDAYRTRLQRARVDRRGPLAAGRAVARAGEPGWPVVFSRCTAFRNWRSPDRAGRCFLERRPRARRASWWSAPTARARWCATQAGIASEARGYGQTAVVANFACGRPHRNVAFQWFQGGQQGGAVLALLPLPGDHVSMVWSTARRRGGAPAGARCRRAGARKSPPPRARRVGELALVTPPRGFPLQRLAARRLVAPRVALAGDAAHVDPSARRPGRQPRPAGCARARRGALRRANRAAIRATCGCCAATSARAPRIYWPCVPPCTDCSGCSMRRGAARFAAAQRGIEPCGPDAGLKEPSDAPRDGLKPMMMRKFFLFIAVAAFRRCRRSPDEAQIRQAIEGEAGRRQGRRRAARRRSPASSKSASSRATARRSSTPTRREASSSPAT